jgi:hypothetical protein
VSLPVQVRHLRELPADRQAVQRTKHPVKPSGGEQSRGDIAVPVRFPQFHAADDAKVRELVAAPLHALQVSVQIHRRRRQRPVWCDEHLEMLVLVQFAGKNCPSGVVRVLGERHRG